MSVGSDGVLIHTRWIDAAGDAASIGVARAFLAD